MGSGKRILVAPMDWGLGHATRSIPVIRALQEQHCEVLIASSGEALTLLRAEFPDIDSYELPAYKPQYPGKYGSMVWAMALQTPRLLQVIRREHQRIAQLISDLHPHGIISDNRYGCWHRDIPSVLMTHQVNILMPMGAFWLKPWVDLQNKDRLSRFHEVWVPDCPPPDSLVPRLSSKTIRGTTKKYIGWLSRLASEQKEQDIDVLILLSGPEPQRTLLETALAEQLPSIGNNNIILVRGTKNSGGPKHVPENVEVLDLLTSERVQDVMNRSKVVVARSGYSTIMDLLKLGKQALLIPTPGQTEQEYLADHLKQKGYFHTEKQHSFHLQKGIEKAAQLEATQTPGNDLLRPVITQWLDTMD